MEELGFDEDLFEDHSEKFIRRQIAKENTQVYQRVAPQIPKIQIESQPTQAIHTSICKHWLRTRGNCLFASECRYLHPSIEIDDPTFLRQQSKFNQSGKRLRKRSKNQGRAGEFRRWLLNQFGIDTLRSGSGILDIAGGKGVISFELVNLNQCKSTIIDPRNSIDYSKLEHKLLTGLYHRTTPLQMFIHCPIPQSAGQIIEPEHLKLFWTPALWESLGLGSFLCDTNNYEEEYKIFREIFVGPDFDPNLFLEEQFNVARKYCWTSGGLKVESSEDSDSVNVSWSLGRVKELLENCSCIIGMHPDQATEAIVDFALALDKPFALLPCCVFSELFPNRRAPDGSFVKNYSDFVDHLCSKSPLIRVEQLSFEGKNTVIFYNPANKTSDNILS
jgi:hypothetical protein